MNGKLFNVHAKTGAQHGVSRFAPFGRSALALIPPDSVRFWGVIKRTSPAGRSATRFAGSATPGLLAEITQNIMITKYYKYIIAASIYIVSYILYKVLDNNSIAQLFTYINNEHLFAALISIIYFVTLEIIASIKIRKASIIINKLQDTDSSWNIDSINKIVENIVIKELESISKLEASIIRNYVTDEFYTNHKKKIDEYISQNKSVEISELIIKSINIIEVCDYINKSDTFSVYVIGKYYKKTYSYNYRKKLIDEQFENIGFNEIRQFIRINNNWLLTSVKNNNNLEAVVNIKSIDI